MSQVVIEPVSEMQERFPGRKRWTRKDCAFLERVGFLPERYELIDGEIIDKMGQNRPHTMAITRVFAWLIAAFGVEFVQTQGDIEVTQADQTLNYPQPDFPVLVRPDYTFGDDEPRGSDVKLAIEVSDSILRGDLNTKAPLYARAGVPEYWVLDISGRQLFVHRNPVAGVYAAVERYSEAENVAAEAAPEYSILVSNLLPPVAAEA